MPGRTLLKHFKDHHGVSPMHHWRNRRFARVREALQRARDDASVTDVAMAWGFYHLGRFAIEYTRRFGESPRDTRGRQTQAPLIGCPWRQFSHVELGSTA